MIFGKIRILGRFYIFLHKNMRRRCDVFFSVILIYHITCNDERRCSHIRTNNIAHPIGVCDSAISSEKNVSAVCPAAISTVTPVKSLLPFSSKQKARYIRLRSIMPFFLYRIFNQNFAHVILHNLAGFQDLPVFSYLLCRSVKISV